MREPEPKQITLEQFLRFFEEQRSERFCFILGAGVSKSSGIPTGEELACRWLEEIQGDLHEKEFNKWIKNNSINMDSPGQSYSDIFTQRFIVHPQYGYDFLEELVENVEPSVGYVFLSKILAEKGHNVVITTNFDSLTEDSLLIHTSKRPLIIGHSDLARYINPLSVRPQVIKVHHDIFLSPRNSKVEIENFSKDMRTGLKKIFEVYTPIIIGYGGNDGGFMETLEVVLDRGSGLYWCFRDSDGFKDEINKLVRGKDGTFIPIDDFDSLMISMGSRMGLSWEPGKIVEIAKDREQKYTEEIQKLYGDEKKYHPSIILSRDLDRIIRREQDNWFTYAIRAERETDTDKKDLIYQQGLERFPESYQLLSNYASFLFNTRKDYNQAEKHYLRALEFEPNNPVINGNYASFLFRARKNYDQAEKCYLRALNTDPNRPSTNRNYANFLSSVRKDHDQADAYYRKALKLDPNDLDSNMDYAGFLYTVKKSYDQAGEYYTKAYELDPNDPIINMNYANFLAEIRKDYDQAEIYYQKSLALQPNNSTTIMNYANFLADTMKNHHQAEAHYQKALKLDANDPVINLNYANFLTDDKNDYDQAETYYRKALGLDSNSPTINTSYANFLVDIRNDYDQAERYYLKALNLDPSDPFAKHSYDNFHKEIKEGDNDKR